VQHRRLPAEEARITAATGGCWLQGCWSLQRGPDLPDLDEEKRPGFAWPSTSGPALLLIDERSGRAVAQAWGCHCRLQARSSGMPACHLIPSARGRACPNCNDSDFQDRSGMIRRFCGAAERAALNSHRIPERGLGLRRSGQAREMTGHARVASRLFLQNLKWRDPLLQASDCRAARTSARVKELRSTGRDHDQNLIPCSQS